jgi:D-3-phosphoglycerate dehydrogenase
MIATCSVGINMIDLNAATELGIVVSNQPGRTAKIVAEHTLALMFAVAKRLSFQTAELKAGRWTNKVENMFLQGKTLGVIGMGNTGREMARLAKAIGMRVIAWTFNPSPQRAAQLGLRFVELDDLLRQSDIVSLHVRLSDESRGMIGLRELGLMKEGSLIINGSRGELIDTAALVEALNSGHLAGAGLDVYDSEPIPSEHSLLSCQQVVLTPHVADMTPESKELLNEGAVDNVIAFLEGHPQNVVTARERAKSWQ